MRYYTKILLEDISWSIKTKQPWYWWTTLLALLKPTQYPSWIAQRISWISGSETGLILFDRDRKGAPKLSDRIPKIFFKNGVVYFRWRHLEAPTRITVNQWKKMPYTDQHPIIKNKFEELIQRAEAP